MTLDVGPGYNVQPHSDLPVVRFDHRSDIRVNVVGDARALPFKDGAFEVVYASHVLEHFHSRESMPILQEWIRVLRSGGELQLFVPNLEWAALQIVNGIYDDFVRNSLFARQQYESDVHRTGFTPAALDEMLMQLPLTATMLRTFRNNICVWSRKA